MENHMSREIAGTAKYITYRLDNLGWRRFGSFIMALLSPVLSLFLLFIPIFGWMLIPFAIAATWGVFFDYGRLSKVKGFRFKKVFVADGDDIEFRDGFYALTYVDGERVHSVMQVSDIVRNKKLELLLMTQLSPKNELNSINLTKSEFKDYYTGGSRVGI